MKKIIYDIGSNNGDDIPYYLMKADIVVSVEANPVLCEGIRERFAAEIQAGRLIVESCVVTDKEGPGEVDFYLHNGDHVLSQLPAPPKHTSDQFTRIRLPSQSIMSIIEKHGIPYYIKIDIEHYDVPLLKALFASEIRPPFISAESHSIEVLTTLVGEGGYKAFKLVDGCSVCEVYADRLIESALTREQIRYSFPFHSAGPFGDDVDGGWLTFDSLFKLLAFKGLGWKDIHATNVRDADSWVQPRFSTYLNGAIPLGDLDGVVSLKELLAYTGDRIIRAFSTRLRRFPHRTS